MQKKITWIDGIKSFYYLLKARFFDNSRSANISILYTSLYMAMLDHFGMDEKLFIISFL